MKAKMKTPFSATSLATCALLLASQVSAVLLRPSRRIGPRATNDTIVNGTNADGPGTWATFDQLIDHDNPDLGTFKQRYYYSTTYWKGTGSPIVINVPAEDSADDYVALHPTNRRIPGRFAERIGGAVILLEHRFFGQSFPYESLEVDKLKYMTIENNVRDITYFAKNFVPPFDTAGSTAPDKVPWIYTGFSYTGSLAGWLEKIDPGTIWAYHGSSAPVQAMSSFWRYNQIIAERGPKNCSKDIALAVSKVDDILINGAQEDKDALKARFKLDGIEDADVGYAMAFGLWKWQDSQPWSVPTEGIDGFHQFCDYVENVFPDSSGSVPGAKGVGAEKALTGYAKWFSEVLLPGYCEGYGYAEFKGTDNNLCFQNSNPSSPFYSDLSLTGKDRQWAWMLCNQPLEWWATTEPDGTPTVLVSRLVTVDYFRKTCENYFGAGNYGFAQGKTVDDVNALTGGWDDRDSHRLLFTNGGYDPWLDATVASRARPGGPMASTQDGTVVLVAESGFHVSDYYADNWEINEDLETMVSQATDTIERWVGEFQPGSR